MIRLAGCLLMGGVLAAAQAPLTLSAYRNQLNTWADTVQAVHGAGDASRLERALPAQVHVQGEAGAAPVAVPLGWAQATLSDLSSSDAWTPAHQAESSGRREMLRLRLQWMAQESQVGPAPATVDATGQQQLEAILSRREFRSVHPPTLWETVRDRINEALTIGFLWLISKLAINRTTGMVLVWSLIGLAAAGVVLVLMRRHRAAMAGLGRLEAAPLADDDWRRARERAQRAARQHDWTGTLMWAYRAGLYLMAADGAWQLDAARTPREYLALLQRDAAARAPWRELIGGLEASAYRGQPPGAEASARALANLERLAQVQSIDGRGSSRREPAV